MISPQEERMAGERKVMKQGWKREDREEGEERKVGREEACER